MGASSPSRTVRVWAAADLHGIDPAALPVQPDGCDVAVLAGDLCPLPDRAVRTIDAQPHWLNVVLGEWAAARPSLRVFAVPGEHDLFTRRRGWRETLALPPNVRLLVDTLAVVPSLGGFRVYGTPWTPHADGTWAFEARGEVRERQWFDCIPAGIDLLVSHVPPRIGGRDFDVTLQYPTQRLVHHGSRPIADAIARVAPTLAVFGHVHTGDHALAVLPSGTALRNVSVLDEDFRVAFRPAVIDVPIRRSPEIPN